MSYTELMGNGDEDELEAYMGIATSDFNFVILRLSAAGAHSEIVSSIVAPHASDITSVIILTDNKHAISFVTVSLDSQIKLHSFEGEPEGETFADGQIITAVSVPSKKDYFVVSTFNEETNANSVCVYRKQKMLFRVGGAL